MLIGRSAHRGISQVDLIVALTLGGVIASSAISLCRVGNSAVATLLERQAVWQEVQAGATLWATEVRGAGFDPTSSAGASLVVTRVDTLAFSGDWNASGAIQPTTGNPNERLSYAVGSGAWKRGVNGGPHLVIGSADSLAFGYLDASGRDLGASPAADSIRIVEIRVALPGQQIPQLTWAVGVRAGP